MLNFNLIYILLTSLLTNSIHSNINNEEVFFCVTGQLQESIWQDSLRWQQHLNFEEAIYQNLNKTKSILVADYTLPVVVHIIHENGSENISDMQVIDAISHLNLAFANDGYYNQGTGLNTNIEFCLAVRNPDGLPTSGINRVESPLTNFFLEVQDSLIKNLSRWNPNEYINVWVVNDICSFSSGCGVAGYATFPNSHGLPADGIVLEADFMGSSPETSSVLVHEMGHYLGLYHTFQGGCFNDDCQQSGDRVCDTPPDQSVMNITCGDSMNSCSTDTDSGFSSDQVDMYWNYMDYSNLDCYSAFSAGQVERMKLGIELVRNSLLDSQGCLDPCADDVLVNLQNNPTEILLNENITFTNSNSNATNFEWFLNGNSVATWTTWTTSFSEQGNYELKIKATTDDPNCVAFDYLQITVICSAQADISINDTIILVGETVDFINNSTNAAAYRWLIDDALVSENVGFSYEFNYEGTFKIRLVAENNDCADTSDVRLVIVQNPCSGTGITQLLLPEIDFMQTPIQLNDGGFLSIGRKQTDGNEYLIKISAEKNFEWAKKINTISIVSSGTCNTHFIQDDADDNIILSGRYEDYSTGNFNRFIAKIDLEGNLIWGKSFDDNLDYYNTTIFKANDGNFLVTEYNLFGSHILKISGSGQVFWNKTYDFIRVKSLVAIPSGGYFLTLNPSGLDNPITQSGIVKLGENGEVIWNKIIYWPEQVYSGTSGFVISLFPPYMNAQGGINHLVMATPQNTSPSSIYHFPTIISTDADGNFLWSKRYKSANNDEFLGSTTAYGQLGDNNAQLIQIRREDDTGFYLLKVDDQGEIIADYGYDFPHPKNVNIFKPLNNGGNVCAFNIDERANLLFFDEYGESGECGRSEGFNPIAEDVTFSCYSTVVETEDFVSGTPLTFSLTDDELIVLPICGSPIASNPELTSAFQQIDLCDGMLQLNIEFCNEGNQILPPNTPISIYDKNPTLNEAVLLSSAEIESELMPNQCTTLSIETSLSTSEYIYVVANDNGAAGGFYNFDDFPITDISECNYFNNLDSMLVPISNNSVVDIGNDTLICLNDSITLQTNQTFATYQWSNGEDASSITVLEEGIYQVTVTDLCGNIQTDEVAVNNLPPPSLQLESQFICEGEIAVLDAGDGFVNYEWQDGFNEQLYTAWLPGSYWVKVEDICGNTTTDTVEVIYSPLPEVILPSDVTINFGDDFTINPTVDTINFNADYQWEPIDFVSCPTCLNTQVMPSESTWFFFTVTLKNRCSVTDSIYVFVDRRVGTNEVFKNQIAIPNIFSPNEDGINDYFTIFGDEILLIENMQIYNRRGNLIFEKKNFIANEVEEGWNGKMGESTLNSGIFVYKIKIKLKSGIEKSLVGSVLLMN